MVSTKEKGIPSPQNATNSYQLKLDHMHILEAVPLARGRILIVLTLSFKEPWIILHKFTRLNT